MKRLVKICAGGMVFLLLGGVGLYFYTGRQGSSDIEQWIGQYLVSVIENQINPTVTFQSIDYQAPYTVVIDKLALTSQGRAMIAVDRAMLELAEIPRRDNPILIRKIELRAPRIVLTQDRAGGLVGWGNFVKSRSEREAAPTGKRPSDVLRLRHVGIHDGQVVYDAADGSPAMTLPGIELVLDTPPSGSEPGAYRLAGVVKRDPIFKIGVEAIINLDTSVLAIQKLGLLAQLGEQQYPAFPPRAQELLRDHRVRGRIEAVLSGDLPLADPSKTRAKLEASLTDANLTYGGLAAALQSLSLTAAVPEGPADLRLSGLQFKTDQLTPFAVQSMLVRLASVPLDGRIPEIERIEIRAPQVNLVRSAQGGFVGWETLASMKEKTGPTTGPAVSSETQAGALPRTFEIINAEVAYSPALGARGLHVGAISLTAQRQEDSTRRYRVESQIEDPSIRAQLGGLIDLTTRVLDLQKAELTLVPNDLLPQLQGQTSLTASGQLPLDNLLRGHGQVRAEVKGGKLRIQERDWPIEQLVIDAKVKDHRADAEADARLLGGTARAHLGLSAAGPNKFDLSWQVRGVQIERAISILEAGQSRYAGSLDSDGRATGEAQNLPGSLSGSGRILLRNGRLMNLPVVKEILALAAKTRLGAQASQRDSADLAFSIHGDRVQLTESTVQSSLLRLRGQGSILYDQRVELEVKGGLLENVSDAFGQIGSLVSKVAEQAVVYEVRGTLSDPKVTVRPLGLGR